MTNPTRSALLLALALAGCAGASQGGPVTVQRWADAPPKPPGCAPEILQKAPTRPYEALGELTSHLTNPPPQPISVVLPKACELGADAVIVQRNLVTNIAGHVLVSVIAIRWRAEPAAVEPEAAASVAPHAPVQSVPQSGAGSLNPREPNY
jgi:hypothetical protein